MEDARYSKLVPIRTYAKYCVTLKTVISVSVWLHMEMVWIFDI